MRTSKQPILVIEENPRQRTRQTRSWQPRQISCRTTKSHPIRQASAGRGSYQDTPSGVPYAREEDVIGFSRLPEIQIYNFVTNCRNKRPMLFNNRATRNRWLLSLRHNCEGHGDLGRALILFFTSECFIVPEPVPFPRRSPHARTLQLLPAAWD